MTLRECRNLFDLPEIYTDTQLKNAYRKKVLETHPDKNNGNQTEFLRVQRAFELLQCDLKHGRSAYNQNPVYSYQSRVRADQVYKQRVKRNMGGNPHEKHRRKRKEIVNTENLKFGCLTWLIVYLAMRLFLRF